MQYLILLIILLSGCAGTGLDKKTTLMPDQIGIEAKFNPQNDWAQHEMIGKMSWNFK